MKRSNPLLVAVAVAGLLLGFWLYRSGRQAATAELQPQLTAARHRADSLRTALVFDVAAAVEDTLHARAARQQALIHKEHETIRRTPSAARPAAELQRALTEYVR